MVDELTYGQVHGQPVGLQIVHLDKSNQLVCLDLAGPDVLGEDEALPKGCQRPGGGGIVVGSTNLLVLGKIPGVHHGKSCVGACKTSVMSGGGGGNNDEREKKRADATVLAVQQQTAVDSSSRVLDVDAQRSQSQTAE